MEEERVALRGHTRTWAREVAAHGEAQPNHLELFCLEPHHLTHIQPQRAKMLHACDVAPDVAEDIKYFLGRVFTACQ